MKQKIYKLLKSKTSADVQLGINLLLAQKENFIIKFFKEFGTPEKFGDGSSHTIHTSSIPLIEKSYVQISNDWLFVKPYESAIRIRRSDSRYVATDLKIISKNEYFYGKEEIKEN